MEVILLWIHKYGVIKGIASEMADKTDYVVFCHLREF